MIEIALIGSTGSVGTQALEVVREHPEEFRIVALTAHKNLPLLLKQIQEFHPKRWESQTTKRITQPKNT